MAPPFNRELEDFAQAFSSGYSMTESNEDRRAKELRNKALEYETSDEALARRTEAETLGLESTRLQNENLRYETSPAVRTLNEANKRADIDYKRILQREKEHELSPEEQARKRELEDIIKKGKEAEIEGLMLQNDKEKALQGIYKFMRGEVGSSPLDSGFKEVPARETPTGVLDLSPRGQRVEGDAAVLPYAGNSSLGTETSSPALTAIDELVKGGKNKGAVDASPPEAAEPPSNVLDITPKDPLKYDAGASPQEMSQNLTERGRHAARVGLERGAEITGVSRDGAVGTGEDDQAGADFLTGEYGAGDDTGRLIGDMLDEASKGNLTPAERTLYGLAMVHDYYASRGEGEKAKDAAAQLVGYHQRLASQYAAFARAAAQAGDLDAASEAAMHAYANVPNGIDLNIKKIPGKNGGEDKYEVSFTREGKTYSKQLLSPNEMGAMAMGITPGDFVSIMSQEAGMTRDDKTIQGSAARELSKQAGVDVTGWTTEEFNAYMRNKTGNKESTSSGKGQKGDDTKLFDDIKAITRPNDETASTDAEFTIMFKDKPVNFREKVENGAWEILKNNDVNSQEAVSIANDMTKLDENGEPLLLDRPPPINDDGFAVIRIDGHPPVQITKERMRPLFKILEYRKYTETGEKVRTTNKAREDAIYEQKHEQAVERGRQRIQTPGGLWGNTATPVAPQGPMSDMGAVPVGGPMDGPGPVTNGVNFNKLMEELNRIQQAPSGGGGF